MGYRVVAIRGKLNCFPSAVLARLSRFFFGPNYGDNYGRLDLNILEIPYYQLGTMVLCYKALAQETEKTVVK